MEIVEASDDESDDAPAGIATKEAPPPPKQEQAAPAAPAKPAAPAPGFKRLQVVEHSDSESDGDTEART
eukprot:11220125-Lingulodinium_polyedra.AAC.1